MPLSVVQFEPSNARLGVPDGLSDLGNPQAYTLAAGAVLGALASWLAMDQWSVGEYNYWMKNADETLAEWDRLGWSSGCWNRDAQARKNWLSFWGRFSKHYKDRGQISSYSYVSDSEELPARDLLKKLIEWGDWFRANCGVETGDKATPGQAKPTPSPENDTDWASIAKWSAFGVLGLLALRFANELKGLAKR